MTSHITDWDLFVAENLDVHQKMRCRICKKDIGDDPDDIEEHFREEHEEEFKE